jgi:hypothetical protein
MVRLLAAAMQAAGVANRLNALDFAEAGCELGVLS